MHKHTFRKGKAFQSQYDALRGGEWFRKDEPDDPSGARKKVKAKQLTTIIPRKVKNSEQMLSEQQLLSVEVFSEVKRSSNGRFVVFSHYDKMLISQCF